MKVTVAVTINDDKLNKKIKKFDQVMSRFGEEDKKRVKDELITEEVHKFIRKKGNNIDIISIE